MKLPLTRWKKWKQKRWSPYQGEGTETDTRKGAKKQNNNIQTCQSSIHHQGLLTSVTFPDRYPVKPQTRWWTQYRWRCICMCMHAPEQAAAITMTSPSLLGGLEMGVPPAWQLHQLNQREQALRAREMSVDTIRQSVSLSLFRASHRRCYQCTTTGTLKALNAKQKQSVCAESKEWNNLPVKTDTLI